MMASNRNASKAGAKQAKGKRGANLLVDGKATQFKPNDPETGAVDERINRKGRLPPKDLLELQGIIDELFTEMVTDKTTGATMDKLSLALNRLLLSKNPSGPIHILDRRFGKVPFSLNIDGKMVTQTWKEFIESGDTKPDPDSE